jgi:hypothetical protein
VSSASFFLKRFTFPENHITSARRINKPIFPARKAKSLRERMTYMNPYKNRSNPAIINTAFLFVKKVLVKKEIIIIMAIDDKR